MVFLATGYFDLSLRPKPGLSERCGEFEISLKNQTNQNLLNSICCRQATDPRDLCFGILPMLQHDLYLPQLTVDYKVYVPTLYTQLASFFLESCGENYILALAAQAKYSGASSWVPDFSVLLRPISESIVVPISSRHVDPTDIPCAVSTSGVDHRCTIVTRSALHHTMCCVSNFINTQHLTGNILEMGHLYNARCIMQRLNRIGPVVTCRLYDKHNSGYSEISNEKPIWTQVFRENFTQEAVHIGVHRMAKYDASILHFCGSNIVLWKNLSRSADPSKLLAYLAAKHLLGVHSTVCNTLATSEHLFFITDEQKGDSPWTRNMSAQRGFPLPTTHRHGKFKFRC